MQDIPEKGVEGNTGGRGNLSVDEADAETFGAGQLLVHNQFVHKQDSGRGPEVIDLYSKAGYPALFYYNADCFGRMASQ